MIQKKTIPKGKRLVLNSQLNSIVAEQFRTIRANIKFAMRDREFKTLLITSPSVGEGKSTIASNLALIFAQAGKKVLLVDADLRKPTVHYTFNKHISKGLSCFLRNEESLPSIIKNSGKEYLDLITCGTIPSNPNEILDSAEMDNFIKETRKLYDLIIYDAPPILSVSDAQILANKCDGTLIVISAGKTEKKTLSKVKEALDNSQAKVIGMILNNYKIEKDHYYYQYYGDK